jgi:choline dehydrogenase-like flavoprotein
MNSERLIGIAGAGSIGCFVGGMLASGGRRVALLARPRVIAEGEFEEITEVEQRVAALRTIYPEPLLLPGMVRAAPAGDFPRTRGTEESRLASVWPMLSPARR